MEKSLTKYKTVTKCIETQGYLERRRPEAGGPPGGKAARVLLWKWASECRHGGRALSRSHARMCLLCL